MTDQITVPRETWDAMREALETCIDYGSMTGSEWVLEKANKALTAANAVSEQDLPVGKCGVLSKSDPQAQGESITLQRWGRAENLCIRLLDPMDDGYWTPWHIAQEAIDSLQKQLAQPQATEQAENEDPLQGAVDWLLQADGEFFAVATVQRTLRIGYNRAKRLADTARERAAAP